MHELKCYITYNLVRLVYTICMYIRSFVQRWLLEQMEMNSERHCKTSLSVQAMSILCRPIYTLAAFIVEFYSLISSSRM